jgi:hypothetical protein
MGAAGLGSTANTGLQTGQQTTGNNISTLQQNIGQAQATGVSGAATAVGGLFGANGAGTSLIGAAGRALTGGAPSGGAPGGYTGAPIPPGTDPETFGGGGTVGASNTVGSGYYGNGSSYTGGNDFGFGNVDAGDAGNVDLGGDFSSFLYCDRRMKEATARLGVANNGLPLYEFSYKDDETKERHVGYMADEVLEKFPDAVTVGPKGFMMVNYSKVPS